MPGYEWGKKVYRDGKIFFHGTMAGVYKLRSGEIWIVVEGNAGNIHVCKQEDLKEAKEQAPLALRPWGLNP